MSPSAAEQEPIAEPVAADAKKSTRATKKQFRPYGTGARKAMLKQHPIPASANGEKAKTPMIRKNTLNIVEDVVKLSLETIAKRAGVIVSSSGRAKMTEEDVYTAIALEFGDDFLHLVKSRSSKAFKKVDELAASEPAPKKRAAEGEAKPKASKKPKKIVADVDVD